MAENDVASETFRIEIRFDVTGTVADARERAAEAARLVDGEVTAIFDENWDEMD
jgi:hypothetical protein